MEVIIRTCKKKILFDDLFEKDIHILFLKYNAQLGTQAFNVTTMQFRAILACIVNN